MCGFTRVPILKLLASTVMLIIGAAGCHHAGMWSMRGINGTILHTRLTYASFGTTIALGGAVCVVGVLAFLLCPCGHSRTILSTTIAVGITAFHYSSALVGMEYVVGVPGLTSNVVMDKKAIIVFVVLTASLSAFVSVYFTNMAIEHHKKAQQELCTAQQLVEHIAAFDLEAARATKTEESTSLLEASLFQIVGNLELYRPFLPDHLFQTQGVDPLNSDSSDSDSDEGSVYQSRSSSTLKPQSVSTLKASSLAIR